MNQLTASGTYVVAINGQEFIAVITGCAPMLQVSRVFNLSLFIEDGTVGECNEVIKTISESPMDFHWRPITTVTELQELEIKDNEGKIKYSQKEYRKWLSYTKELEKPELISKLMMERKDLTYSLCELLVEQLWKDRLNLKK